MLSDFSVKAVVSYYPSASDTRAIPVSSGYQPKFSYNDESWAVEHNYTDGDLVYPGDRVEVLFNFHSQSVSQDTFFAGMAFHLIQGERIVGEGTVLAVN